jgi:hypothetical protein
VKAWIWILIVGGLITYFAYSWQKWAAWVAGLITALLAWNSFRMEG